MIKFFRKVRQKMLSENRFSKYLFYAIGEIVLVVIGILLALQINNWNNSVNESKILNSYAVKIKSNIEQDISQIGVLTEKRNSAKDYCNTVMKYFRTGKITDIDSLNQAGMILYEQKFSVNKSGFNSLINSGYIEKLPNGTFSDNIYAYYELVDELDFIESKYNVFCETMEYNIWESGVFDLLDEMKTEDEVTQRQSLKELEEFKSYKALYWRSPADIYLILDRYEKLATLGNELILNIEQSTF